MESKSTQTEGKTMKTLTIKTPAGTTRIETFQVSEHVWQAPDATQVSTGRRVVALQRHTDFAVPMTEVVFADGHRGMLKDEEIVRDHA